MAEDKVLEEIQFHQDVIRKDLAGSPLYQIREKEMEITGRVLAAKKQAETIVADARKKAAETVAKAETAGDKFAKEAEERVLSESEQEAERVRSGLDEEVAAAEAQISANLDRAVDAVARAVAGA